MVKRVKKGKPIKRKLISKISKSCKLAQRRMIDRRNVVTDLIGLGYKIDEILIIVKDKGFKVTDRTIYSDYNSVMGIVDWEKETKKMAVKLEWGETRAAREYIASKDPKDKGMWLSIYRQFQHTKTNFLRKRDINIYNADKIDVHNGDKNIKIDLDTLLDSIDKSKREVIEIVK